MKEAIVSLDLDFLVEPYYQGNYFVTSKWHSKEDFRTHASKWIDINTLLQKINAPERIRGCIVNRDDQVPLYLNNLIERGYTQKKVFTYYHFDAHHDTWAYYPPRYYRTHSLSDFKPFEANLALFYKGIIDKVIWVVPDYFTQEDIDWQMYWRHDEIKKDPRQLIYRFQFLQNQTQEIEVRRLSEVSSLRKMKWKYFAAVINDDISLYTQEDLKKLKEVISEW